MPHLQKNAKKKRFLSRGEVTFPLSGRMACIVAGDAADREWSLFFRGCCFFQKECFLACFSLKNFPFRQRTGPMKGGGVSGCFSSFASSLLLYGGGYMYVVGAVGFLLAGGTAARGNVPGKMRGIAHRLCGGGFYKASGSGGMSTF